MNWEHPVPPTALSVDAQARVCYHVGKLADKIAASEGVVLSDGFRASLGQIVLGKAAMISTDLTAFVHHRGRSRVSTDDVLMLGRHNKSLVRCLLGTEVEGPCSFALPFPCRRGMHFVQRSPCCTCRDSYWKAHWRRPRV